MEVEEVVMVMHQVGGEPQVRRTVTACLGELLKSPMLRPMLDPQSTRPITAKQAEPRILVTTQLLRQE